MAISLPGGLTRLLGAAAIAGAVVGGTLGLVGFGAPEGEPARLALDSVPTFLCPGDGEVGTLHRGDRVLITGRSGDWLAVRNVRGGGERVFVSAAAVTPDSDLGNLPEEDCEEAGTVAIDSTATTVTSTTTTIASATTVVATTTTTEAATTTTSIATATSIATTTTTTTSPDQTPPSIANASAVPTTIWELDFGGIQCGPVDRSADISAFVTDSGGVASVTLLWEFDNGSPQSKPMSGSGTYTATFGPFPYGTVDDNTIEDVTLTIRVVDTNGNIATTNLVVSVRSSAQCFG